MNTLTQITLHLLQDPENREIVNEGQDICYIKYKCGVPDFLVGNTEHLNGSSFDELEDYIQLAITRWCIKLLPCFDRMTSLRKQLNQEYIDLAGKNGDFLEKGKQLTQKEKYRLGYLRCFIDTNPKTIRQALLTCGAMNLEELEKYAQFIE